MDLNGISADYVPDIERSGESEDKAGEEYAGRGELELAMLSILEVTSSHFYEEKYREDYVQGGEDDVICYLLYLRICCGPSVFNGSCHISCTGCEAGDGNKTDDGWLTVAKIKDGGWVYCPEGSDTFEELKDLTMLL